MGFDKNEVDQLLADCGRKCCICGTLHKLQIHHIKPKDKGGSDAIDNGIPLCPNCHDEVHTAYSSGKIAKTYSENELRLHRQRTINITKYHSTENSRRLSAISVSPSISSTSQGSTLQFRATAHYFDGTTCVLSTDIVWTSTNLFSLDRLRIYTPISINSMQLGRFSPLSHEDKLAEARRQFNDLAANAKLGDANAIGAMQSISTILLALSRQYYASSISYFNDFENVKNTLTEIVSLTLKGVVTIENAPALANLEAYVHILTLGELGGLSPESKLVEARHLFSDLTKRSKLGDTKALWQLETVSAAFLKASHYYFGGGTGYANDCETVRQARLQIQQAPVTPVTIANSGIATGIALGTSVITATSEGISGTSILSVIE